MKSITIKPTLLLAVVFFSTITYTNAQIAPQVKDIFPEGTVVYGNLSYAGDTLKKHQLDIYLPAGTDKHLPLIVWIHGGGWMANDKYADMGYMKSTVRRFIDSGYALASIDYRYSTDAVFPAQIQDCNQALEFLYQHADQYRIDKNKIALIGFSAGGHLASLLGLSNNNNVKSFYPASGKGHFRIKCVLDFYGPSDLIMLANNPDTLFNNDHNPVSLLLGAQPIERPDLAKVASPVTYVDKGDPSFLIIQGEKDLSVPNTQSKVLHAWLDLAGVKNDLVIVPGAPHYGEVFDADYIRTMLFWYLRESIR